MLYDGPLALVEFKFGPLLRHSTCFSAKAGPITHWLPWKHQGGDWSWAPSEQLCLQSVERCGWAHCERLQQNGHQENSQDWHPDEKLDPEPVIWLIMVLSLINTILSYLFISWVMHCKLENVCNCWLEISLACWSPLQASNWWWSPSYDPPALWFVSSFGFRLVMFKRPFYVEVGF